MKTNEEIFEITAKMRDFFLTGVTSDISFRLNNLLKLKKLIQTNESKILAALKADFNKPETEAYTSEISYVYNEIDFFIKKLKKLVKPIFVPTPLINKPGKSYYYYSPLGVALIIAPANYPFGLSFTPIVDAMAAGNCIILKPSELVPETGKLIRELIYENFPQEYFSVVNGDKNVVEILINQNVNFIFFTGGEIAGGNVLKLAANFLIPCVLELGGKNPCIIDKSADLKVSARRLAWGKFFNSGQTCVAPDYAFVDESVYEKFIEELKSALIQFYGTNSSHEIHASTNKRSINKLNGILKPENIIYGGKIDLDNNFIEPTLMKADTDDKIMKEEIFAPVLAILKYKELNEAMDYIRSKKTPLALYIFSNDENLNEYIIKNTFSGSVGINSTLHILNSPDLPFGGVSNSGMGSYRRLSGFETFSQKRAVLKKPFWFDLKVVYPPYKTPLDILKKAVSLLSKF